MLEVKTHFITRRGSEFNICCKHYNPVDNFTAVMSEITCPACLKMAKPHLENSLLGWKNDLTNKNKAEVAIIVITRIENKLTDLARSLLFKNSTEKR